MRRITPKGTVPSRRRHYRHSHRYVRLAGGLARRVMARQFGNAHLAGERHTFACPCGALSSRAAPRAAQDHSVERVAGRVRRWWARLTEQAAATRAIALSPLALFGLIALTADAVRTRGPHPDSPDSFLSQVRRGWLERGWRPEQLEALRGAAIVANTGAHQWNEAAGGAWVGGVIPGAGDTVTIPPTANITIPAAYTALCRSIDVQALATIAFAATSSTLTVGDASGGAATFSSTCTVTLTAIGTINFVASTASTVYSLTTAGKVMPNLSVSVGSTTTIRFADAVTATGATITHTAGKLETNGMTVTAASLVSSNTNTRTLDITNSTIAMTATSGTSWSLSNVTGLTFISTGSSISVRTNATTGAVTYNNFTWNTNGPSASYTFTPGNSTFANLNIIALNALKTDGIRISTGNVVVTGTFTCTGNSAINRIDVVSSVLATPRVITAAAVAFTNVDFMDITIAGAAAGAPVGTSVGDCGGNTGITFTPSATQTATGTASFTWSTHGWTTRVPLPQDDVVINSAFVAGRTITADMPRLGRSIDFTGATGAPTANFSVSAAIFGSLTMASGMAVSGGTRLTLSGRNAYTLTSAGVVFTTAFSVTAPSGTYTLQDAFTTSISISSALAVATAGTLVDNGMTVTLTGAAATYGQNGGTLTKTGAWSFGTTTAVTFWNVVGTMTDSGSITLTTASSNTRTFAGGGKTYGTLTYTVAGSTGALVITGTNTFGTINFSDASNARTLTLPASTTTTITTLFNVTGTAGKLMTIASSTGGTRATLSKTSGAVAVEYVNLVDSQAQGGARWSAGRSTNGGNNTGWLFGYYIDPSGSITPAGTLSVPVNKMLAGTVSPAGAVQKQIAKTAGGTVAPSGTLADAVARAFAGTITPAGVVNLAAAKNFAGTIIPSGDLTKDAVLAFAGAVTPEGTLTKALPIALAGQITPTGALVRAITRAFAGQVTPAGDLDLLASLHLSGTITPQGDLSRRVILYFAGLVTPTGVLVVILKPRPATITATLTAPTITATLTVPAAITASVTARSTLTAVLTP